MWAYRAYLLLLALSSANGLMFYLEPNNRKCLKEEIHKGVLVTGEYDIAQQPNQIVDLMVVASISSTERTPIRASLPSRLTITMSTKFGKLQIEL